MCLSLYHRANCIICRKCTYVHNYYKYSHRSTVQALQPLHLQLDLLTEANLIESPHNSTVAITLHTVAMPFVKIQNRSLHLSGDLIQSIRVIVYVEFIIVVPLCWPNVERKSSRPSRNHSSSHPKAPPVPLHGTDPEDRRDMQCGPAEWHWDGECPTEQDSSESLTATPPNMISLLKPQ